MRERRIPSSLHVRLRSVLDMPGSYTPVYIGRATKRSGGVVEIAADDQTITTSKHGKPVIADNRRLGVTMSQVTLRGKQGKRHTFHVGWLPTDFQIHKLFWGMGKVYESL